MRQARGPQTAQRLLAILGRIRSFAGSQVHRQAMQRRHASMGADGLGMAHQLGLQRLVAA